MENYILANFMDMKECMNRS